MGRPGRPPKKRAPAAPASSRKPPLPKLAEDKHSAWYLNWLVDRFDEHGRPELTARDAACVWAGVSTLDHSLIGALNIKAGFTDAGRYVSVNEALNHIAYGTTNRDDIQPWLSDVAALHKICRDASGG